MRRDAFFSTALTILSVLFFSAPARAQSDDAPKAEVGVQFSSLSVTPPEDFQGTENKPGFGGRFTYNLTDNFALEAEGNFFPTKSSPNISVGGRAVQAQFGVKAGKRFERFGVFAKARPGFISFGEAVTFTEGQTVVPGGPTFAFPIARLERKTHLSVDLGGVLEFYPSRRTMVRFDAGDTLIRYGERNDVLPILISNNVQSVVVPVSSKTKHNFQFSAGIGYRFGGGREQTAPAPDDASDATRKFEVGIQFSSLVLNEADRFFFGSTSPFSSFSTSTEAGFGGRLTYNLNEYVAVEAESNFYPRKRFSDTTAGGYPFQAQFGAKVGRRYNKFGVFAKARPGFVGFTAVNRLERIDVVTFGGQPFSVPAFESHSKKYFSADVGGVFEFYPSSRWLTRFDFGDTIIRYTNRRDFAIFNSQPVPFDLPADTRHNFQFSAGIGYRF